MIQNCEASLIYVADPMCSWCYAFAPEITEIVDVTGLPVRMVMGGLFVEDHVQHLDDSLRDYLRDTWTKVSELSGQPISYALLDRTRWIYDTAPACRALVAAQQLAPERTRAFFSDIQQAFYAHGADVTDTSVLSGLAASAGFDPATFEDTMNSDASAEATKAAFREARDLGAVGFPTLILQIRTEQIPVAAGYVRAAQVIRAIDILT